MKEYLPLGSVVTLKEGEKKLMICGRVQREVRSRTVYDYCACLYPEGRMVSEKLMLAQEAGLGNGETPIFPILIFKVKEGINYNPGDPNYDLFKLACRVSAKRLFPNFEFLDAPFNLQYYEEGKPRTGRCDDKLLIVFHDPILEVIHRSLNFFVNDLDVG